MNLEKLRRSCEKSDYQFYKNIVVRIARLLEPTLTVPEAIAIADILHMFEITFSDGFVLNSNNPEAVFGRSEAAIVIACICDTPDHDWKWWKTRISPVNPAEFREERFELTQQRMLGRILLHQDVISIGT